MKRVITMLTAALVMAAMMVGAALPVFAQADNFKNKQRTDTTVTVGGEQVEGERKVSSHQVRTPSGNVNSQTDVHEEYENDYKFHSHGNTHNGDVKNTQVHEPGNP